MGVPFSVLVLPHSAPAGRWCGILGSVEVNPRADDRRLLRHRPGFLARDRQGESSSRCVLMFHRIVDVHERDHDVSWPSFFRALRAIRNDVTTNLRLSDPGACVVLTFDDGTSDHAQVGQVLADQGLQAIFFVPAGVIGLAGFLARDEVCGLHERGHVVGSHGLRNIRLTGLSVPELRREVRESKQLLDEIVGSAPTYFSPPGGSDHPLLIDELAKNGFVASRSVRWGVHRSEADRWHIPCIPVTEFTVSRGWVEHVLTRWSLPLSMRSVWVAKEHLPVIRSVARALSHRGRRR